MSSEAVWVAWNSCLRSIPTETRNQIGVNAAASYCACWIDAVRSKGEKGANMSDFKFCMNRARSADPSRPNAFSKE